MRRIAAITVLVAASLAGCDEESEPLTPIETEPAAVESPSPVTATATTNENGELEIRATPGGDPTSLRVQVPPQGEPEAVPPGQNTGDQRAPDTFAVRMTTDTGEIIIDVTRAWAPRGADRFYTLVREGYFVDVAFFRVIEGFMAQGGLHGDPAVNARWRSRSIPDDPVVESNRRGMVTYAMAGPNTRSNQFFINLVDNQRLDSMGFAPFGRVRDMAAVDRLYSGYGEGAPRGRGPDQSQIQQRGNAYLQADFPQLSYIRRAEIIE